MRRHDDEDGTQTELHSLVSELQRDADRLNRAIQRDSLSEELKHMAAALADKIDGLASLIH